MLNDQESGEDALRRWIDLYQTQMLRMSYILLGDLHLAEDAVQETFLKAYQARRKLRDPNSEKAWLMTIAANICRGYHRTWWGKHVDRRVPLEQTPVGQSLFPEEESILHLEVERLPYRQREVVLLYYYQGMNMYEIAKALHISQSTVSDNLDKAQRQLKLIWEDNTHELST